MLLVILFVIKYFIIENFVGYFVIAFFFSCKSRYILLNPALSFGSQRLIIVPIRAHTWGNYFRNFVEDKLSLSIFHEGLVANHDFILLQHHYAQYASFKSSTDKYLFIKPFWDITEINERTIFRYLFP